ncbi:MAG: ATP-binding cassette domain-containing protein [Alphaproteobacteria bacterium]|jgi:sodium transport system ATP-binding protein|nr:ATP-binding cassette domain-containing protein [Alphaproteobacteria bacterium]
MIEIADLHKRFGAVQAVAGLSLSAVNGRVTGLIGPNGAGKTTTFRIVSGLLRPDAGHVAVDGCDVVSRRREAQSRIGVLPDERGLYPRLTARETISYFGRLHGLDKTALKARTEVLIASLGMSEFADRRVRGFSRGQALKVALARALVHRPANIILDEPTNGLDVISTRAVRRLIHDMRDEGACILISSHLMAEVANLCDDLVIIAHGRAVLRGTPEQLRARLGTDDLEDVYVDAMAAAVAG